MMTDGSNNNSPVQGTLIYLGPRVPGPGGVRGTFKGYCLDLPVKGERFRIFQGTDYIDTSVVQRVDKMLGNTLLITTENSVYEWRASNKQ